MAPNHDMRFPVCPCRPWVLLAGTKGSALLACAQGTCAVQVVDATPAPQRAAGGGAPASAGGGAIAGAWPAGAAQAPPATAAAAPRAATQMDMLPEASATARAAASGPPASAAGAGAVGSGAAGTTGGASSDAGGMGVQVSLFGRIW